MPAFLHGLKARVRRLHYRARNAFINRFCSFTPDDFQQALHGLGVQAGDVLCVHSSFDQFLGFRRNIGDALTVLQDAVGSPGGIVMPTQPFTRSAIEYVRSHPVTDLARSPTLMGADQHAMPERVREGEKRR